MSGPEMEIRTADDLRSVLAKITFGPSGVMLDRMDLQWEIEPVHIVMTNHTGWVVRFTFNRPDNRTGEMGRGAGRWEIVEAGARASAVVKTCWLLLELLVRHELMEAFLFDGVRLFDPHRTVDELAMPGRFDVSRERGAEQALRPLRINEDEIDHG